jgi:hypothetical protein
MGFVQKRLSDISGVELADNEAVTVVDKTHGKVFDAAPDELKALKGVVNVVELEYRYPSGQVATLLVQKADYEKLVPTDKLAGFDSNRGRRSGYSPKQNGSSLIRSSSAS